MRSCILLVLVSSTLACSQPAAVLVIETLSGSGYVLDERLERRSDVASAPSDALGTQFFRAGFSRIGTARFGYDPELGVLTKAVLERSPGATTTFELPTGTADCRCAESECVCVRYDALADSSVLFELNLDGQPEELLRLPGFNSYRLWAFELGWLINHRSVNEFLFVERNGGKWSTRTLPPTLSVALDARGRLWSGDVGLLHRFDMRTGATEDVAFDGRSEVAGSTWDGSWVLVNQVRGRQISWLLYDGRSGVLRRSYERDGNSLPRATELCSSRGQLFAFAGSSLSVLGESGLSTVDYLDTLGGSLAIGCR
ncbi:MAG: hypothetical protein AB1730_23025 [Myxococcota bacterium]